MQLTQLVSTSRANSGVGCHGEYDRNDLADAYSLAVTAQTQLASIVTVLDLWSRRRVPQVSASARATIHEDFQSVSALQAQAQASVDRALAEVRA